MANRLLNVCLDVTAAPAELTLQPNGGGDGTYYFELFNALEAPPTEPTPGQRVDFARSGAYRLIAWDAKPPGPTTDPAVFREPTWLDPAMAFSVSGAVNIVSASEGDPWPPS